MRIIDPSPSSLGLQVGPGHCVWRGGAGGSTVPVPFRGLSDSQPPFPPAPVQPFSPPASKRSPHNPLASLSAECGPCGVTVHCLCQWSPSRPPCPPPCPQSAPVWASSESHIQRRERVAGCVLSSALRWHDTHTHSGSPPRVGRQCGCNAPTVRVLQTISRAVATVDRGQAGERRDVWAVDTRRLTHSLYVITVAHPAPHPESPVPCPTTELDNPPPPPRRPPSAPTFATLRLTPGPALHTLLRGISSVGEGPGGVRGAMPNPTKTISSGRGWPPLETRAAGALHPGGRGPSKPVRIREWGV